MAVSLLNRLSQQVVLIYQHQYCQESQWLVRWVEGAKVWANIETLATPSMNMSDHIAYLGGMMPMLYRVMIRCPQRQMTPPRDLRRLSWQGMLYETIHPWSMVGSRRYIQTVVRELDQDPGG